MNRVRSFARHGLTGALVAAALLLRLAVPAGWMPAAAGGVMPCPGTATMAAMPAMAGMGHDAPTHGAPATDCAFAALAVTGPAPDTAAPPRPPRAVFVAAPPPIAVPVRVAARPGTAPPATTGPPFSA